MSWVCDNCSCNNDDEVNECFVCGEHRSAESIRLARIRAIEKKREAFNDILYSRTSLVGKLLMIVVGVLFIIACIIKIVQGSLLFDLEGNLRNILGIVETNLEGKHLEKVIKYLAPIFEQKGETVSSFCSSINITTLTNTTLPLIQSKFEENFAALTIVFTSILPESVKFDAISFAANLIQSNSTVFFGVFEQYISQGYDKVLTLEETFNIIGDSTDGKFDAIDSMKNRVDGKFEPPREIVDRLDGKLNSFNKISLLLKNKYDAVLLIVEYIIGNITNSVNNSVQFIKHIVLKYTT